MILGNLSAGAKKAIAAVIIALAGAVGDEFVGVGHFIVSLLGLG